MNTLTYNCGCSITRSMFGEQEIIRISNCHQHAIEMQFELEEVANKIIDLQNKDNE